MAHHLHPRLAEATMATRLAAPRAPARPMTICSSPTLPRRSAALRARHRATHHRPDHSFYASPLQKLQLSLHVDGRLDEPAAEV